MMKIQIKAIAALLVSVAVSSSAGTSEAGRPFGRFSIQSSRSSQNYQARNHSSANRLQTQNRQPASATSYANNILLSPERMEKIYGPSILLTGNQPTVTSAVSQP